MMVAAMNAAALCLFLISAVAAQTGTETELQPCVALETQSLLTGDSPPIVLGQVKAKVSGENLEIELSLTQESCLVTSSHICNVPTKTFTASDGETVVPYTIPLYDVYDFVCTFDDDFFVIAGHAQVICKEELVGLVGVGGEPGSTRRLQQGGYAYEAYYEIPIKCEEAAPTTTEGPGTTSSTSTSSTSTSTTEPTPDPRSETSTAGPNGNSGMTTSAPTMPTTEEPKICTTEANANREFLPDGIYRLKSHRKGGLAPPTYGIRLDGLLTGQRSGDHMTFNFDYQSYDQAVEMRMTVLENKVTISGKAWGGKDIGTEYDAELSGLWEINFEYNGMTLESGPKFELKSTSDGDGSGTITKLFGDDQRTFNLAVTKKHTHPFHFRLDKGHRTAPDTNAIVGHGWVDHQPVDGGAGGVIGDHIYASDWLFEVDTVIETFDAC